MRALLVNPWIHDFKAFDFWNKPVGLLIVSSLLRQCGFEVDLLDCLDRFHPQCPANTRTDAFGRGKYAHETIEKPSQFAALPRRFKRYGIPRAAFLGILRKIEPPDVILVTSSMTYWYPGVFEAIRLLRDAFPRAEIILGGIYATLCHEHACRSSGADTVLAGPAETSLIPHLHARGYIKKAPETPAWTLPDYSAYAALPYGVVLPSKGCPFRCSYCATHVLAPGYATAPNNLVLEQLADLAGRTRNIAFFDDALLCNKGLPALLGSIIERGWDLNLHSSNGLHCRSLTPEIARLMKNAGFQTVYLSLETIDPKRQEQTGGKVFTAEFLSAVDKLVRAGFPRTSLHVYLLFGLPGQAADEIIEAIGFCHASGVQPHLCEFSPIPHTDEYDKTGLAADADPLLHNNYFHTWHVMHPDPALYRRIKDLLREETDPT